MPVAERTKLAHVYGGRVASTRAALGGWGFEQVCLPGCLTLSPRAGPRSARDFVSAASAADAAVAACRPLSARCIGTSSASTAEATLSTWGLAKTCGAWPQISPKPRPRRGCSEVREALLRDDLKSADPAGGVGGDVAWLEELSGMKSRTKTMREKTLQLLKLADETDQAYKEELHLPAPSDARAPKPDIEPVADNSDFEDGPGEQSEENARKVVQAFKRCMVTDARHTKAHESERAEMRKRTDVFLRHSRSRTHRTAFVLPSGDGEDEEPQHTLEVSDPPPDNDVPGQAAELEASAAASPPSAGSQLAPVEPAATLLPSASSQSLSLSASGEPRRRSSTARHAKDAEKSKLLPPGAEDAVAAAAAPSSDASLAGKKIARPVGRLRSAARKVTTKSTLHSRLIGLRGRGVSQNEGAEKEISMFESKAQLATCKAPGRASRYSLKRSSMLSENGQDHHGAKSKPLTSLVQIFEVDRPEGAKALHIKAHVLAPNKILDHHVAAEAVDHFIAYCVKLYEKRGQKQSKDKAPMRDETAEDSEDDAESARRKSYPIVCEVLELALDQNERPRYLHVPGYEPPVPDTEPKGQDALVALRALFGNNKQKHHAEEEGALF